MPAELGLQPQLAAPEGRHGVRGEHSLRGQPGSFRRHRLKLHADPAFPLREPLGEIGQVAARGEQQQHGDRIGGAEDDVERGVSLHGQLKVAFRRDLVDAPSRAPALLLFPERADQALVVELAQLRVERAAGDPAPGLDVRELARAPDLMAVHRPPLGEQAKDHESTQVHRRLVCTY